MYIDVERLKSSINIVSWEDELTRWSSFTHVNCYQFMLNLEYDFKKKLQPGYISGLWQRGKPYKNSELIEAVKSDLDVLGFDFRYSTLCEEVKFGEWKCAIFNFLCDDEEYYDFHFLRQNHEGVWMQKFSNEILPRREDFYQKVITNPGRASFEYPYYLVGYFMISAK